jgi:hypothetical protein
MCVSGVQVLATRLAAEQEEAVQARVAAELQRLNAESEADRQVLPFGKKPQNTHTHAHISTLLHTTLALTSLSHSISLILWQIHLL